MGAFQKFETTYNGTLEAWKVRLIQRRAKRWGFKGQGSEEAIQEVELALKRFAYDPLKSNGASERTVLTRWIDCKLANLKRSEARLQARDEQYAMSREVSYELKIELQADVQHAVATLPPFERNACELLVQGVKKSDLATQLNCKPSKVKTALRMIANRFCFLDVDEWMYEK